jgi:hypothetical protein
MQKGQSLFEIVVAISLIALICITIISLTTISLKNNIRSRNKSIASGFAQEAYEWLREQKSEDWGAFYSKSSAVGETYCFSSLLGDPFTNTGICDGTAGDTIADKENFERTVFLQRQVSPDVVLIDINVDWVESDQAQNVNLDSFLSKY